MTEKEFLQKVLNAVRLVIITEQKAIELIEIYYRTAATHRESNKEKKPG